MTAFGSNADPQAHLPYLEGQDILFGGHSSSAIIPLIREFGLRGRGRHGYNVRYQDDDLPTPSD